MEFKERLRRFIKEQEKEEDKVHQEELLQRRAEEDRKRIAEVERLKQIIKEKFVPYFEAINEVFLENRGKLSVSPEYPSPNDVAYLTLSWDEDTYMRYDQEGGTGNRMHLTLNLEHEVRLNGGRLPYLKPDRDFKLEDEGWQQQLDERILFILSAEAHYRWEYEPSVPKNYDHSI